MAYNDDQKPTNLPAGKSTKRKSADHLPRYFRTQVNNKFLSSTIDQLIQPGVAEKLSGYFATPASRETTRTLALSATILPPGTQAGLAHRTGRR